MRPKLVSCPWSSNLLVKKLSHWGYYLKESEQ